MNPTETLKRLAELKQAKIDAWNSSDPLALAFAEAAWYAVADSTNFAELAEAVEGMDRRGENLRKLARIMVLVYWGESDKKALDMIEAVWDGANPVELCVAAMEGRQTDDDIITAASAEIARLRERVAELEGAACKAAQVVRDKGYSEDEFDRLAELTKDCPPDCHVSRCPLCDEPTIDGAEFCGDCQGDFESEGGDGE